MPVRAVAGRADQHFSMVRLRLAGLPQHDPSDDTPYLKLARTAEPPRGLCVRVVGWMHGVERRGLAVQGLTERAYRYSHSSSAAAIRDAFELRDGE